MAKSIQKEGWKDTVVRLMVNPNNEDEYLCIDGMHRIEAMKRLMNQDIKFRNYKIGAYIYPLFCESDQCILADSNFICFIE